MSPSNDRMTPHDPVGLADLVGGTIREITTAAGQFGLSLSRTYASDVDDLWSAWTDPERMARWLGRPFGDLREGGVARLVMSGPDGTEPPPGETDDGATITILHCDAPTRLIVKWVYGHEDPSIVDLTLKPGNPGHTLLRLDHVVLGEEQARGYGAGWEDFLTRLAAALEGRDPQFDTLEPQLAPLWGTASCAARPALLPTTTRTDGTDRLDHERWVAADPAAVWDCLSTAEGLRRWYVNDVTGDLCPGGSFRCVFDQGTATGEVLACDPRHELRVSWRWDGADRVSRMTLTLTAQTRDGVDGTHVAWREHGASGDLAAYGAGIHAHLVGLDRAARGLVGADTRWSADFVLALSQLKAAYTNPFGD